MPNRERAGDPDVNSFIYWGGQSGFDPKRRSEVPTRQANAVCISDINGDDWLDLAFANGQGDRSYAYLNSGGRFAPDQRLELPTHDARDCAVSDLNRDGFADVFFTNHQASANPLTVSYLYWGSPEGYSPERREEFETVGAWGVSLADLNRDSWGRDHRLQLQGALFLRRTLLHLLELPEGLYPNPTNRPVHPRCRGKRGGRL